MLTIQRQLVDFLAPWAADSLVSDVRIGLGYTAVALESGHAGVAWTPKSESHSCTHFSSAGSLTGRPASVLLSMLCHTQSPLARAVGLATANALLSARPNPQATSDEVIHSLALTPDDRVAMVGHFAPVVANIQKSGCRLDILELNPQRGGTLCPEEGRTALAQCSVAIITGTSLINGTFDQVLADLGSPRAAVLLGPSSPLCTEAFLGTKITHIAGARVRDMAAVLRVVSEGGGTMLMKPHLDFVTLPLCQGA
ncbi:MAG: DUF364 domain-containing protein [Desulfuromonadales bacterium]|nr:DUF364 domain-containing protein [Desulfuromonadales bacterium]